MTSTDSAPTGNRTDADTTATAATGHNGASGRSCSRGRWQRGTRLVHLTLLLAVAACLRGTELSHLPGINGDEAWYGIEAQHLLRGEPVAWRTPSGNLLNPFYFLPLVALHWLGSPSFLLLRIPAVLSGMVALALNYWLCQRAVNRRVAIISTVLLAVLPINLAYARFGWDASQSLLATLPVLYLPLWALSAPAWRHRLWLFGLASFAAAVIIHPTNVFAAPWIVIPFVWNQRDLWRPWLDSSTTTGRRGALLAALTAGIAVALLISDLPLAQTARSHLNVASIGGFLLNYLRLFNGEAVYQYIAGSPSMQIAALGDWPLTDLVGIAVAALAGFGLSRAIRTGSSETILCLIGGWATSLCGFLLVAGPDMIAPHLERYGIVLLAPAVLLISYGIDWWLTRPTLVGQAATLGAWAVCWLLVAGFHDRYLDFMRQTGGDSHPTFRTGQMEPKQVALIAVQQQRGPGRLGWLVTSESWNYRPLLYLGLQDPWLRIVQRWPGDMPESSQQQQHDHPALPEASPPVLPPDSGQPPLLTNALFAESPGTGEVIPDPTTGRDELAAALQADAVWFVEFSDSTASWELRRWLRQQKPHYREYRVLGYGGRAVLSIFGPPRSTAPLAGPLAATGW